MIFDFWQSAVSSPYWQKIHFKRHILKKKKGHRYFFSSPKRTLHHKHPFYKGKNILHVVADFPSAWLPFPNGSNWGRKVCRTHALMFWGRGAPFQQMSAAADTVMENERHEKNRKRRLWEQASHKPEAHTQVNWRKCSSGETKTTSLRKLFPLVTPFYF